MSKRKLSIFEFETKNKNRYIFDNVTGLIIPSSNEDKFIIENITMGEQYILNNLVTRFFLDETIAKNKYNYIKTLVDNGYFYMSKEEKYLSVEECREMTLKSGVFQLILIITESCNLRCKYCIYNEHYPYYRTYSNKNMNFEVAKRAIDLYFELYQKKKENGLKRPPMISFYGGEPLIGYKLIKEIVNYCKMFDYDVQFYITTNGTLLNNDIIEFLVDNSFNIAISLDGNKANHNRNRVYIDGKGTFDTIVENIYLLDKIRKERGLRQPLTFICCYDDFTDMKNVIEFFETLRKSIGDFNIVFNEVYRYDTTYYDYCKYSIKNDYKFYSLSNNAIKTLQELQDVYIKAQEENKEVSLTLKFLFQIFSLLKFRYQGFMGILGNACAPGDKIAVDPEGNIFICEKAVQKFDIGNVMEGIKWDKVQNIVNKFLEIRYENCADCNISRLCEVCYVHFMSSDNFRFNSGFCNDKKRRINKALSILYSVLENNPYAFEY
ncbi:Radical SAM domain protein [Caldicellulosiruptor acetigenus I77R1B]|uniref:Radical SAM domain protein n=1 Tax=Caldicellulosiruptor acetigenus (strain ATCC 700853 / DSM 12137 / I77R1B) TaxID=632335 RepID=E4S712_CALA7|nr:radical SAM protein [Caldicellulosiruptor acetigenus]ADQ39787.1 Radical SAM domain protein [Caldicellulosiruptor acetigenus I77R1B]